ncbi:sensor histidine kinase [Streptomyces sp. NRRL S-813]|uniref:sensor histidine kinase n=1 Tax=Streptomyces sp. NRRL S-813 TaxID=1463919 RepID=UPI00056C8835|nr:ATP-binding protein [Streptomyces sp. NRRL S-813]
MADRTGDGSTAETAGRRTVRRALTAMVLIGVGAFALVGAGTVVAADSIAEKTALAEAARSAQLMGNVIFKPAMQALLRGDGSARTRLDEAVQARQNEGGVVRVKVWNRQGDVLYSNEHRAIGMSFPNDDVRRTIDQRASWADLSDLSDEENVTERYGGRRLVEVYVPLDLDSGERLALEVYSTDARVTTARTELMHTLVPFSIGALLLLLAAQLPVSIHLLHRVSKADAERSRLLSKALTASERERRTIARDLHDGVVQDLAGAGYALSAVRGALPPGAGATATGILDKVGEVLRGAVGSLRTMMVDIYPPDLTEDGLPQAVELLAERLRRQGISVTTTVEVRAALGPDLAALVYRCTRECVTNVLKHAAARHAWIEVTGGGERLLVRVADDGKGPGEALGKTGHLGLQLIRDTATELGGGLTINERPDGGTEVRTVLPLRA